MAKRSAIARNERRRVLVERHREQRTALKATIASPETSTEDRSAAVTALQRLPRDSSPSRLRRRDVVDGRPRGHLRAFGLSRVRMREMAHRGELPGVTKASW